MEERGKRPARKAAVIIVTLSALAIAAAGLLFLGRRPSGDAGPRFDGKRAYANVRRLVALGPRVQGSPGEAAAAEYLKRELAGYGYKVEFQRFVIPGVGTGRNIVASRRSETAGTRWLAVGAHYDTVADTVGANDNASGAAVVLELAKVYSREDIPYSLRFVFFSAEEDQNPPGEAYLGSSAYVADLTPAKRRAGLGYINVDMVGWSGAIYIGNLRSADRTLYDLAADSASDRRAPRVYSADDSVDESDHQSFEKAGIQTVSLGALDYPYRHKPNDNLSKISRRRLEDVGRLIVAVLQAAGEHKL